MKRFAALISGITLALLAACGTDEEDSVTPGPIGPGSPQPAPRAGALPPTAPECAGPAEYQAAAQINAGSMRGMVWAPFGREEVGWVVYAPKVAAEIRTRCASHDPAFAAALARWQQSRQIPANGVMTSAVFDLMKARWHAIRPYVAVRGLGICPEPPPEYTLARAAPQEGYSGKEAMLRPAVLAAYRRMVADARAQVPEIAADPQMLTIFSAYRSPAYDAARCEREGNCNGITRAQCSVHRTGMAMDLVVGAAPGHTVDSSADPNRLHMTRTPAYLWLVDNAERYGFVNYVFEPWHWEWTGEALLPPQTQAATQTRPNRPLGRQGTERRFEPFPADKENRSDRQSRKIDPADAARRDGGRL